MAFGLIAIGFALRLALSSAFTASPRLPPNLISWHRLWGYFAFCLLQQVALNSLVHNRMMSLIRNEWTSAGLTGVVFAACHWPNPVLVPLTFVGGTAMAWLFGRHRNIIPLAIGQAIPGLDYFLGIPDLRGIITCASARGFTAHCRSFEALRHFAIFDSFRRPVQHQCASGSEYSKS